MSEQIDELVDNLKRPSLWKRVFFTLGFALLFNIILVPLVLDFDELWVPLPLRLQERRHRYQGDDEGHDKGKADAKLCHESENYTCPGLPSILLSLLPLLVSSLSAFLLPFLLPLRSNT